jgi:outer membrane receptor for ferrienterochelin and colicins
VSNGIDPMSAQEALPFDTRVTRQSVYLQDEWEIHPQWAAYLGLRGEALRTESLAVGTLPAASSQRTLWSPVLHLRHKLTPGARDLLRFSAGRSFKPPELAQLVGRYALNTLYPKTEPNTELAPDRAGNPALRPEQVTTFDLALEKYLSGGGVLSAGVFHRQVDGLIRQRLDQTLLAETGVLRWVFRPANLARARSTGLEFEVKGRADELLPAAWSPSKALNLRASLSVYRSAIDGLPGPNDRLDGQQPWQATLGFDHALGPVLGLFLPGVPVTIGASAAFTPGYVTQQTAEQRLQQAGVRNIDAFVLFSVSRSLQLRLSGSDLAPRATLNTTTVTSADHPDALSQQWRRRLRTVNASLVAKF